MNWKFIGEIFALLLLIVAFKYSFDSYASESIIKSFGSFTVGLISFVFYLLLVADKPNSEPAKV